MDSRKQFLRQSAPHPDFSYSAVMRFLHHHHPERMKPFMEMFKQIFDSAVEGGLENPIEPALMETCLKLGIKTL